MGITFKIPLRPPAISPLILGFSRILGFLDKILGTSLVFPERFFCTKITFRLKNWAFFLKFFVRSFKILHILGALGKNLGKILTKGFKNLLYYWQTLQDVLHWEVTEYRYEACKLIEHANKTDKHVSWYVYIQF